MIKILAIDDISDNLISLKAILQDLFSDILIVTALNGNKGLELAVAENPDVILLDILMPGMDGFEVCRLLKENEQTRDIPVVFLTALKEDKENRIKALECGAEGFIAKPIDETELTAQVRAMVKIKRSNEAKREEKINLFNLVSERTQALENELKERNTTEKLLRESEFFFKESQSAAFIGSYQFNIASNYWSASEILEQIFGIDHTFHRTFESWLEITHPDDRTMIANYFQNEVIGQRGSFNKEYRIIRKSDGETRWVLGLGQLSYDEKGNILAMTGTIQDITQRKKQEESLRESNDLNQSLLKTIPFGMDIVDEEGNILFISENLKLLVGQQVLGKKCWDLYRDNKNQCTDCPLFKGIQIGSTRFYESSGILGGKTFLISHTGMMFQGKKAMLEIFQDITEKKEVEKKVKLLAHSLESITECVSITDNDDLIIYVNNSFAATYGYTTEELIGKHTSKLRPPDIEYAHVRDILPITIEGGWKGEIMNRKKDGTLFPIALSTSVIKDDNNHPLALIGVASDITEMRKSREELIFAKEKAEESNRLKNAFLNNMSHEIRTPMNHIMGFSSLMSEAECKEKDAFAEIILNSSNQLLSLIENVILLSRLQSERAEIINQPCSPEHLLAYLRDSFNKECLMKNLAIHLDIPQQHQDLTILSDADKIRQILREITANAVKYTEKGSIKIGYEVLERHNRASQLRFFVKDTGLGIPEQEQPMIFDSFFRTDEAISKAIGGTGLGLSIVRELARSMNGAIEFKSSPGSGTTFYFSVPLVTSSSTLLPEKPAQVNHNNLKDLVLLIADDEQINYLYLEILLKNLVKKIDHATNGSEVINLVSNQHYDMIFMDLKMPEMDGYEATRIVKQLFPAIPVIAQTAYASIEDKEMALLAGCDDFIAKPIKKSHLLEVIQKYS